MGSYNFATFVGNVAADGKMREAGESDVLGFRIAVNNRRKRDAEPLWVNVSVWGKRGAALCEHVTKGKTVCVGGPISLRTYTTDSGDRTVLEMDCQEIELLGGGERDRGDSDRPSRGRDRDRDDPGPDKSRDRKRYEEDRDRSGGEGRGRGRERGDRGGGDDLPF